MTSVATSADIVTDNHHIYQDTTGFHYDVTLTKVDTKYNTNERYNLVVSLNFQHHPSIDNPLAKEG